METSTTKINFNPITTIKTFGEYDPPCNINIGKTKCGLLPNKNDEIFPEILPLDLQTLNLNLRRASANGQYIQVKCLISNGAEIDSSGKNKWTPLHWASYRGQYR